MRRIGESLEYYNERRRKRYENNHPLYRIQDLPAEKWFPVVGLHGYFISTAGRIKSIKRKCLEKIISQRVESAGYPVTYLFVSGKVSVFCVHRLLALSAIPNPNNYPCVLHVNDIKTDNRIENLKWGTYSMNTLDAFRTGVAKGMKGEDHPMARFKSSVIMEIFNSTLKYRELSKIYDISEKHIDSIKTGKIWSHLTGKVYSIKRKILPDDIVLKVFNCSGSTRKIAAMFNVNQTTVQNIKSGKYFCRLTDKIEK